MERKYGRPELSDVLGAISYRLMISDLAETFESMKMYDVAGNLKNACLEIDRIWEENDFIYPIK